jgi:protocatechuate 3,4-dioxygenase alpha subunit
MAAQHDVPPVAQRPFGLGNGHVERADEAIARCRTDQRGEFRFTTVKPGPVPGRGNAQQAPHFAIALHARGLLKALMTRAYFSGDPLNETDPLLSSIEDAQRRATLLARPESESHWRLDIRLQRGAHGEAETVFLDI